MALTLQECINKVKKEYPKHFPYTYVECEGKYVFNLVAKGTDPKTAISDMHVVDPETGDVTGGISIIEFLKDPGFRKSWEHANLVSNHDESLSHSFNHKFESERGWKVRRNQNGGKKLPFGLKADYSETSFSYGESLQHYGVPGQKWGVQNGPPYPLNSKLRNQMAKDAVNNDGKAGMSPNAAILLFDLAVPIFTFLSLSAIAAWDSSPKRVEKRNTKAQEEFDIKNKDLSKDLIGDIADVDKVYSADNPPRKIEGAHSVEDDMSACNPRYKNGVVPGTSVNCVLCSCTYDLRRRGYDVTALSSNTGNYPDVITKKLYKNPKEETINGKNFSEIFENAAKQYPEGARGLMSVQGRYMAHAVSWEIRDGKMEVLDAQRNVKMTPSDFATYGFYSNFGAKMIRTDNLDVNHENINLVAAELKPGWKKTITAEQKALKTSKQNRAKAGSITVAQKHMIQQYKQDHPGTKLSDKEILNNLV